MERLQLKSLLILFIGVLMSCSSGPKEQSNTSSSPEDVTAEEAVAFEDHTEQELPEDALQEFGLIKEVDDIGYPLHIVVVEFPERDLQMYFKVNVEAGIIGIEGLNELVGSYLSFYYTSDLEPNLLDIHFQSSSLMGEYAPESLEGLKVIQGVLSEADEPTPGDLPGEVIITASNGNQISFEYFVTDEMVEVNNKEVTAYYDLRPVHEIVGLAPVE